MEQGYCFYPGVLDADEQDQIRRAMDAYWRAQGGEMHGAFGFGIHPLMGVLPELAPFLAHPLIVETLGELFDDEVHLVHAGGRMSTRNIPGSRIGWHHHYGWDEGDVAGRARPRRALAGFYVDGTSAEIGQLLTLPRKIDDPIDAARGALDEAWPGEVEITLPPGSISILDTAVWHDAKAGTQPGMRRIFGSHYQAWSCSRPHPEDNDCDVPEIESYKRENPRLRGLVERGSQ